MDSGTWFIGIFVGVAIILGLGITFVPVYGRWRAYRQAAYLQIDLPRRLERAVAARLMARERGGLVGAFVVGGGAMAAFASGLIDEFDPALTRLFIIGAVFAGLGLGTAIAAMTGKKALDSDGPRVARSRAASVGDYAAPVERIGARVSVAVVVVVFLGIAISQPPTAGLVVAIGFFAVASVLTLAVFEMAGRRIVGASQPAGSTAELVWDDAIRASVLRDLITAPLSLAVYGTVFGLFATAQNSAGSTAVTAYIVGGVVLAGLAVTLIASVLSRPRRYFITRLWPNLRWSDTADTVTDAA